MAATEWAAMRRAWGRAVGVAVFAAVLTLGPTLGSGEDEECVETGPVLSFDADGFNDAHAVARLTRAGVPFGMVGALGFATISLDSDRVEEVLHILKADETLFDVDFRVSPPGARPWADGPRARYLEVQIGLPAEVVPSRLDPHHASWLRAAWLRAAWLRAAWLRAAWLRALLTDPSVASMLQEVPIVQSLKIRQRRYLQDDGEVGLGYDGEIRLQDQRGGKGHLRFTVLASGRAYTRGGGWSRQERR
jgi:hypothetical protein